MKMNEDDRRVLERTQEVIHEEGLEGICRILHESKENYHWVGVYLVRDDRLKLGPFKGDKTEHTDIPFGRGVCGRAAVENNTIIVDDVSKENEYLSCSPKVKSEIVVPIERGDEMVGEIDIDSHAMNAFDHNDEELLKEIASLAAEVI
ncbi:MAG: GAF domain-containing protein [Thermoplasmata archaeon]